MMMMTMMKMMVTNKKAKVGKEAKDKSLKEMRLAEKALWKHQKEAKEKLTSLRALLLDPNVPLNSLLGLLDKYNLTSDAQTFK